MWQILPQNEVVASLQCFLSDLVPGDKGLLQGAGPPTQHGPLSGIHINLAVDPTEKLTHGSDKYLYMDLCFFFF